VRRTTVRDARAVIGRAGRSGRASRALLQTRYPQHPLFAALVRQDYAAFADTLLAQRERAACRRPPISAADGRASTLEAAIDFLRLAVERAGVPTG